MKAAFLRVVILIVGIATVGTGLRDLGLSKPQVLGLFFGAILGGMAALLRLRLSGESDMRWPLGGALGLTLIGTFFRDLGIPLPFTAMEYQEGTFFGLLAGALAVWLPWPLTDAISKVIDRSRRRSHPEVKS
jgi:hypothetical protein